jgi:Ni/Co efflux regulator RcnB
MKKILFVLTLIAATAFSAPLKGAKTDTTKTAKTTNVVKTKKAVKAKKVAKAKKGDSTKSKPVAAKTAVAKK